MKCALCGDEHSIWYSCQAWKDVKYSTELAKKHIPGRYCKEWQRCWKCSELKNKMKILRHLSGQCKSNKNPNKCPVCVSPHMEKYHKRNKRTIINRIYVKMLGVR